MKPTARKSELIIKEDTGELFIQDLKNSTAIFLNPTAAYVWQKCDGKRETSDIAIEMEHELGIPVSENVVEFTLKRLSLNQLLESNPQFS